jgi:hypothetical protein
MQKEIGATAGLIWETLHKNGELSLAQLKREVKAKAPVFDWAIGWLAREDKILIARDKRSLRFRLKQ